MSEMRYQGDSQPRVTRLLNNTHITARATTAAIRRVCMSVCCNSFRNRATTTKMASKAVKSRRMIATTKRIRLGCIGPNSSSASWNPGRSLAQSVGASRTPQTKNQPHAKSNNEAKNHEICEIRGRPFKITQPRITQKRPYASADASIIVIQD